MKQALYWMVMFFIVICLSGCGLLERKTELVFKTEVIAPEDPMLVDCDIPVPPVPDTYMAVSPKAREKMLFDVSEQLYRSLFACNVRYSELRTWKVKSKAIYENGLGSSNVLDFFKRD